DLAGDVGAGCDVNAPREPALVIDGRTGVDDALLAELDLDAHHGAGEHVAARADPRVAGDVGRTVNRGERYQPLRHEPVVELTPSGAACATDRADKAERAARRSPPVFESRLAAKQGD